MNQPNNNGDPRKNQRSIRIGIILAAVIAGAGIAGFFGVKAFMESRNQSASVQELSDELKKQITDAEAVTPTTAPVPAAEETPVPTVAPTPKPTAVPTEAPTAEPTPAAEEEEVPAAFDRSVYEPVLAEYLQALDFARSDALISDPRTYKLISDQMRAYRSDMESQNYTYVDPFYLADKMLLHDANFGYYYTYYDIDGNGTEELILRDGSSEGMLTVAAVYT